MEFAPLFFIAGVMLTSIVFGLIMGPLMKRVSEMQTIPLLYEEDVKSNKDINKWREYAIDEYLYHPNPYTRELLNDMEFPEGYKEIIQKEMMYGFKSLTTSDRKFLRKRNQDIGYYLGLKAALNTKEAKTLREETKNKLEENNATQ